MFFLLAEGSLLTATIMSFGVACDWAIRSMAFYHSIVDEILFGSDILEMLIARHAY